MMSRFLTDDELRADRARRDFGDDYDYEDHAEERAQLAKEREAEKQLEWSIDQHGNNFRTGKHVTSIVTHFGLAVATGGASLLYTGLMSCISHLARGMDAPESGNRVEATYIGCQIEASDAANPVTAAIKRGVLQSLLQTTTRPLAYAFITAGAAVDITGYGVKALRSTPLLWSKDADEKLRNLWISERNMAVTNTLRHVFWKAGCIAPSDVSCESILNNSLLVAKGASAKLAL